MAGRLGAHGVRVLHDRCTLRPGQVVVHAVEEAIRQATTGIQVLSPAARDEPWLWQEYAALLHASVERGLRLIPVLHGEVELPPFAATRVPMDFRALDAGRLEAKVAELARLLLDGEPGGTPGPSPEVLDATRAAHRRPPAAPTEPNLVVCYARSDTDYGERLASHLRAHELAVWTIGRLTWGDDYLWRIREQLRHALAVIVLMSTAAQDSADLTREILEGQRHGREFFPVLLEGDRHHLLASSWYFDARGGALPGDAELRLLRRLAGADEGPPPPPPAPPPPGPRPPRPGPAPGGEPTARLRQFLAEREFAHADLLTTSLLLAAAGRQESGWLRRRDGERLPAALLTEIDAAWSAASGGRHGFRAQRGRAGLTGRGRHADFLELSAAYGWRGSPDETVPRYAEFATRGGPGFYPTLRNPQCEQYLDWYDQWTETALAVHARLREWEGEAA
ncbi:TIR domain-containing protein [Streptomyces hainanensis]|uniref:TIR domain-containing protein n=1 Tax=Streptomyces hainanensis TaxID=402648 RepID=A0A4R4SSB5_9ACTN|nr:TIR domain-containing protein [Streptomyces hainanensis]